MRIQPGRLWPAPRSDPDSPDLRQELPSSSWPPGFWGLGVQGFRVYGLGFFRLGILSDSKFISF